ncbi:unnamed protein product, partial [Brenthis ino]
MDQNLWLLVEWMDNFEQNIFSNYAIVHTDSLMRHDPDIHTGKVVVLRDKHNNPRKAQVLRFSDKKRFVKELKVMLERQDNQVKNVLSLCMNAIKEMKTGPMFFGGNQTVAYPSGSSILHHARDDSDSSDSNSKPEISHDLNLTKTSIRCDNQLRRNELRMDERMSRMLKENSLFSNCRPPLSSTPLPDRMFGKSKSGFDKATQTELAPPNHFEKIEQINVVLQKLYSQFMALLCKKEETQNHLLVERASYGRELLDVVEPQIQNVDDQKGASGVKIRRVSAQTTNNVMPADNSDLVSIGNGNVTIPARVLEEIDWSSHSVATRQLLQAVFPRRVLATHSLTGKQSPAFVNKPPKKQLDPRVVEDIVNTVSERCGVPQRIVRSSITTKCTDEAKLYRNRQRYKKMREEQNQENIAPISSGSSESTNIGEEN